MMPPINNQIYNLNCKQKVYPALLTEPRMPATQQNSSKLQQAGARNLQLAPYNCHSKHHCDNE
jgi:hypothetical protein